MLRTDYRQELLKTSIVYSIRVSIFLRFWTAITFFFSSAQSDPLPPLFRCLAENILISWATISLSRRTLLRGLGLWESTDGSPIGVGCGNLICNVVGGLNLL